MSKDKVLSYSREHHAKKVSYPRWRDEQRERPEGDPIHALMAAAVRQAWDDLRGADWLAAVDAFLWLGWQGDSFLHVLGLDIDIDQVISKGDMLHKAVEF